MSFFEDGSVQSKEEIHVRNLAAVFAREDYSAVHDELMKYREDTVEFIANAPIHTEQQRAVINQYKGKLQLIDMWLTLPKQTETLLEKLGKAYENFKGFITPVG